MKENNNIDSGFYFLIRIFGFLISLIFKIILFPFRVFWHNKNSLNVTRVRIEKLKWLCSFYFRATRMPISSKSLAKENK